MKPLALIISAIFVLSLGTGCSALKGVGLLPVKGTVVNTSFQEPRERIDTGDPDASVTPTPGRGWLRVREDNGKEYDVAIWPQDHGKFSPGDTWPPEGGYRMTYWLPFSDYKEGFWIGTPDPKDDIWLSDDVWTY